MALALGLFPAPPHSQLHDLGNVSFPLFGSLSQLRSLDFHPTPSLLTHTEVIMFLSLHLTAKLLLDGPRLSGFYCLPTCKALEIEKSKVGCCAQGSASDKGIETQVM